ncbi:hypothetical protein [Azospirillum thermophilum]|uniref:hypothetical protein n=1 Tax=Azospirillum thermophilum TaxID=2202148 RepID=UPI0011B462E6|nr:hypothetical protein [Azospirillum thermophilum]
MAAASDWRTGYRRYPRPARRPDPHRAARRRVRAWSRDLARLMLVVSLLVLGVLAVEMGRKAMTVMVHAQTAQTGAQVAAQPAAARG